MQHTTVLTSRTHREISCSSATDCVWPWAATIVGKTEGLAAIMESHFRFEERELEPLIDRLELHADPDAVFGPL